VARSWHVSQLMQAIEGSGSAPGVRAGLDAVRLDQAFSGPAENGDFKVTPKTDCATVRMDIRARCRINHQVFALSCRYWMQVILDR